MASHPDFVNYMAEQLREAGAIRSRKMFGEYGLYCDDVFFAVVCDDQLFVMGWTTYHQIVTALSPDIWPYEGRPCYVVTHRQGENQENVCFWNGELTALADQLKTESKGNVWICGGASVARQLLKENRIDKLWLSVIPTVLGKGVRLFPGLHRELPLKLVATEHYNGIVDLVYEKR